MCAQWGIMALLAAFAAAALALAAAAAGPTLTLQNEGCPPSTKACTGGEPVCGSDGRTYATRCDFERAQCEEHSLELSHVGPCSEPTPAATAARCLLQRKQQQSDLFVPECAPDGGFKRVQCHHMTGYCWCVDDQGRPLAGTSMHLQQPNCTTRRQGSFQRRASHQGQAKIGCSSVDRSRFNQNLVAIFQKEYDRLPKPHAGSTSGGVPAVLEWKFSELDLDNDSFLQLHEVRDLRRLARRIVEPQACARGLARYCDANRDRSLSRSEWLHCLQGSPLRVDKPGSVDAAAVLAGALRPGPELTPPEDEDSQETQEPSGSWPIGTGEDCSVARKQAQEAQRDAPRLYVPECQPDGRSFMPAQCLGGLCWCVSVKTGRPLRGTTSTARPDCAQLLGDTFKGCPFRKKQLFLAALVHSFEKEQQQASSSPSGPHTAGDDVLRWKFSTLDINHNQVLERKEWKQFRRGWASFVKNGGRKKLRKCWRNFLRFCDENDDSRISQDEWLKCGKPLTGSAQLGSGTRRGPNPFSTILISR
ncbi:hypothetical protein V5799_021040 [Amblyomma americanum]|uniref:SPARC-related modular calcium-binding protein 2 n=1 Tax=Amblyomma americanum TaxID=6943 RepID=A0AAQ4FPK4_AMBAM